MSLHVLRPASRVLALATCLAAPAALAQADGRAAQAFEMVRSVLQHPRCQNCHIPIDAPLQFDAGMPHAMNVKRAMKCVISRGYSAAACFAS